MSFGDIVRNSSGRKLASMLNLRNGQEILRDCKITNFTGDKAKTISELFQELRSLESYLEKRYKEENREMQPYVYRHTKVVCIRVISHCRSFGLQEAWREIGGIKGEAHAKHINGKMSIRDTPREAAFREIIEELFGGVLPGECKTEKDLGELILHPEKTKIKHEESIHYPGMLTEREVYYFTLILNAVLFQREGYTETREDDGRRIHFEWIKNPDA